jgi:hypothetical protein
MKTLSVVVLGLALLALSSAGAAPLGTAFTYQGQLTDAGAPANGHYDLTFTLYDAVSGGAQVGPVLTTNAVTVSDGLFTVGLDFGTGAFAGNARWLEIAVQTNGGSVFTSLLPRQAMDPVPYALYALTPAGPQGLQGLTGAKGDQGDPGPPGTITDGSVTSAKLASDAASLFKVSAGSLAAVPSSGNIGIGTLAPGQRLDVQGNALVRGPAFGTPGDSANLFLGDGNHFIRSIHSSGVSLSTYLVPDGLLLQEGSGNVGIGTSTPAQRLDVAGNIGYSGQLSRLDVAESWDATVHGANLLLGSVLRRGTPGRALVDFSDRLCVNFAADWPTTAIYGGVVVDPDNINNGALSPGLIFGLGSGEGIASKRTAGGNQYGLDFYQAWQPRMSLAGGNVGIGTTAPQQPLHVVGRARFDLPLGSVNISTPGGNPGLINFAGNGHRRDIVFDDLGMRLLVSDSASAPSVGIDIFENGTTRVKALEIIGGSDLAEPFQVSDRQPAPKGAVMVIDPRNPGRLRLSDRAYDHCVAGVLSGAAGLNPGLTISQQGLTDEGAPVALCGRVYTLADAANGGIQPGDLLTTSDTPGHAMKVTEPARAQGAVLGKAMTGLASGKGLVLVLVSLQ